jgi:hypothetical protein
MVVCLAAPSALAVDKAGKMALTASDISLMGAVVPADILEMAAVVVVDGAAALEPLAPEVAAVAAVEQQTPGILAAAAAVLDSLGKEAVAVEVLPPALSVAAVRLAPRVPMVVVDRPTGMEAPMGEVAPLCAMAPPALFASSGRGLPGNSHLLTQETFNDIFYSIGGRTARRPPYR